MRQHRGTALLIAGMRAEVPAEVPGNGGALPAQTRAAMTRLSEVLMAADAPWHVHRLASGDSADRRPERAQIKRHIDDYVLGFPGRGILAISGTVVRRAGQLYLLAGPWWRSYPDEHLIPFSWLSERVRACSGSLLFALDAHPAVADESLTAAALLAEFTPVPDEHLALVCRRDAAGNRGPDARVGPSIVRPSLIEIAVRGLGGEAVEPTTGVVSLTSLAAFARRTRSDIACSAVRSDEMFLAPPPLLGLWDPRWSRSVRPDEPRIDPFEPGIDPFEPAMSGDHAETSEMAEDLVGTVLPGRFRVVREIGRGSFGVIYRAHQMTLARDVAIKVLHPGAARTSEDGRLFVREIRAIGRIDHANVIRVYQADLTRDGRLFFAMELLRGDTLAALIDRDGPQPMSWAMAIMGQLLAGLAAAHDAGIVHADIKPANIVLVPEAEGPARARAVLLDFGLSRLHAAGEREAAGGTLSYMAPEQLRRGRVDMRSDVFAAALVLYHMLTGWQRQRLGQLVPPLDRADANLGDAPVRAALDRALRVAPDERFADARAFARALHDARANDDSNAPAVPDASAELHVSRPPFRRLASFTEDDEGRFFGREDAITDVMEHALFRRALVYAAPSGAGKTSLLRAGLVPRARALRTRPIYVCSRHDPVGSLVRALDTNGASEPPDRVARERDPLAPVERLERCLRRAGDTRLIVILDHVEALFVDNRDTATRDALLSLLLRVQVDGAGLCVLLSIREDFLARLLAWRDTGQTYLPIVRLGPLRRAEARAAIVEPLAERRVIIDTALVEHLLDDLQDVSRDVAKTLGWHGEAAIYPPHLQLACAVLWDTLEPGETQVTRDHYQRVGGLDAIVGRHFDQVLDSELESAGATIARAVFLELVTSENTRLARSERHILATLQATQRAPDDRVRRVLDTLRTRGLLVPVTLEDDEPGWELVHDSLVPRVLAWADRRELGARRAKQTVRYHLHRSTPASPSLLDRRELRDIARHPGALEELESEYQAREAQALSPRALVARSRRMRRVRVSMVSLVVLTALVAAGWGVHTWLERRSLEDRDMGVFVLELQAFDRHAEDASAHLVDHRALPDLEWQLYEPDADDPDAPGQPVSARLVQRTDERPEIQTQTARAEVVEARGGTAFLRVHGRQRAGRQPCPPSWVKLVNLPGFISRSRSPTLRIRVIVPTCQATRADMIEIPEGPFIYGGAGQPPTSDLSYADENPETLMDLPGFWMDRTEVTNAAYRHYADNMSQWTRRAQPSYPKTAEIAGGGTPRRPVAGMDWYAARDYCRFMGKRLPSSEQWEKAARGGLYLDAARTLGNPMPRRNLPWGLDILPVPANLLFGKDASGTVEVDTFSEGRSPYGIADMVGNVQEWTRTQSPVDPGFKIVRGGGWFTSIDDDTHSIAFKNERYERSYMFDTGMRCVLEGAGSGFEP